MVFKNLCVFVVWKKVASALEGLTCEGEDIYIFYPFTQYSIIWPNPSYFFQRNSNIKGLIHELFSRPNPIYTVQKKSGHKQVNI